MTTMSDQMRAKCPKCGTEFPLTDAIVEPMRSRLQDEMRQEYDQQLNDAKKELEQVIVKRAEKQTAGQVQELRDQVKELSEELKTTKQNEAELRKMRRTLERRTEDLELEVSRRVDEQAGKAKQEMEKRYSLRETQHAEQIEALKRQIDDLKRRAEQTSQQAQGEALEGAIQSILSGCFPNDIIDPVPTGMRGADVLQRVNGKTGRCCGTIIWESKNTRNWSNSWLDKLKANQRDANADIAVIASAALPSEVRHFGLLQGVWVTDWSFASQLASALRTTLIQVSDTKMAVEGREHKIEFLYDYLTSTQFKQRVETVVDAFNRMRDDLAQERQAMMRSWSKREKQIELVMQGTAGLYGDIQGIAGAAMPEIEALQMPYQLESGSEQTG